MAKSTNASFRKIYNRLNYKCCSVQDFNRCAFPCFARIIAFVMPSVRWCLHACMEGWIVLEDFVISNQPDGPTTCNNYVHGDPRWECCSYKTNFIILWSTSLPSVYNLWPSFSDKRTVPEEMQQSFFSPLITECTCVVWKVHCFPMW